MNIARNVLGSVALLGAVALATPAYADVAVTDRSVSGSNGSSVIFFLQDTVTQAVYARELGITFNDVFQQSTAQGAYTFKGSFSYNNTFDLTGDANLNSFLTSAGSNPLTFAILAGSDDSTISPNGVAGAYMWLMTKNSQINVTTDAPTNVNVNAGMASMRTMFNSLNTSIPGTTATDSVQGVFDGAINQNGTGLAAATSFLGTTPFTTQKTVNTAGATTNFLYVYATNTGANSSRARVYENTLGVSFNLAAKTVVFGSGASTGGTEVPLPAAAWLLLSGLFGLAGVRRRAA